MLLLLAVDLGRLCLLLNFLDSLHRLLQGLVKKRRQPRVPRDAEIVLFVEKAVDLLFLLAVLLRHSFNVISQVHAELLLN